MSNVISSQYLEEIQSNIRVRPIPWEGYVRANLITTSEAALIKTIEKQPKDKSVEIIDKDGQLYALTLIDLLNRITRDDVVKYILSLLGDFAKESEIFSKNLLELEKPDTFEVLIKLLEKSDEQTHLLSCKAILVLIDEAVKQGIENEEIIKTVNSLLTYINKRLINSPNVNLQDIAIQSYGNLLKYKKFRNIFWQYKTDIIPCLIRTINNGQRINLQLQYYSLLVFWLISFEKQPSNDIILQFDLIPVLLDIIKNSVKEKIIRLSIAILVNTVNNAPKVSIPALLSHSTLNLVITLNDRKWTDEELIEDLQYLKSRLQEAFDSMTTFDEYESEIIGKNLKWSPPHRSDTFWKENIHKFKDSDFKIIRTLSTIINNSTDPITLAVGCNDISRIITELPESLKILEKLGTKIKIMQLMNHSDSDVKYEALKATQTFIAHSFK